MQYWNCARIHARTFVIEAPPKLSRPENVRAPTPCVVANRPDVRTSQRWWCGVSCTQHTNILILTPPSFRGLYAHAQNQPSTLWTMYQIHAPSTNPMWNLHDDPGAHKHTSIPTHKKGEREKKTLLFLFSTCSSNFQSPRLPAYNTPEGKHYTNQLTHRPAKIPTAETTARAYRRCTREIFMLLRRESTDTRACHYYCLVPSAHGVGIAPIFARCTCTAHIEPRPCSGLRWISCVHYTGNTTK